MNSELGHYCAFDSFGSFTEHASLAGQVSVATNQDMLLFATLRFYNWYSGGLFQIHPQ